MPIDSYELDAEEGRSYITTPTFCGKCGYELRMLPWIGQCPECGQPYKARGRKKQGIFMPHLIEFPAIEMLGAIVCPLVTLWLLRGLVLSFDIWVFVFALTFGVMSVIYIRQSFSKTRNFARAQRLLQEIQTRDE